MADKAWRKIFFPLFLFYRVGVINLYLLFGVLVACYVGVTLAWGALGA